LSQYVVLHIDAVPNRTPRATYLLRESFREGKRVRKRTLANLSSLSDAQIEAIRAVLAGETVAPVGELFETVRSLPHGHVQAVGVAMQRLGLESLIASRPCAERDRICALVAARLLAPHTKLPPRAGGTPARSLRSVPSPIAAQRICTKRWTGCSSGKARSSASSPHDMQRGALALYDLSSSYFEGKCCPLAKIGHNRDLKRN
jgi:hypothetical protein